MPVSYDVKTADGSQGTITADQLMGDLQAMGANVAGMDPTGESVKFRLSNGQEFDTPVNEVLGKFGYTVAGSKPLNPNYEALPASTLTGYRFAVGQLGDDDQKKQYLEMAIKRMTGDAKPKIMGSGQDFYYYSPDSGWTALTNKPGMDFSDIGEYGPMAAKTAAAIGGGIAAGGAGGFGTAGIGAIPAAMAGAGGASALANTLLRGSLLASDDDFAAVSSIGDQAMLAAPEVAIDTLLPGATGIAGKVGGPAVRKLMTSGPISGAGAAVSSAMKGIGHGTQKVSKAIVESPFARQMYSTINPVTQSAEVAGWLAQLPGQLTRGSAKVAAGAGDSKYAQAFLGKEGAEKLGNFGKELIQTKAPTAFSEKFRNRALGKTVGAEEASSKEILEALGEKTGNALKPEISERTVTQGIDIPKGTETFGGLEGELAKEYKKAVGKRFLELNDLAVSRKATGKAIGAETGKAVEALEGLGRTATGMTDAATKAQLRALQGIGYAMEKGGQVMRPAFRASQPVENLGWLRHYAQKYGQEENYFGFAPSQRKKLQDRLKGNNMEYTYNQN